MKKTNDFTNGIILGLALVTLPLLLLSTTKTAKVNQSVKYQLNSQLVDRSGDFGGRYIAETIFDTTTGEIISRTRHKFNEWK